LDAASINTHASGDVAHGGLLSCIVGEHERLAIDPRGQPDGELTTETDTHRQDMVGHTATWMQRGPYSGEGDVGKVEVLVIEHRAEHSDPKHGSYGGPVKDVGEEVCIRCVPAIA
jgi:hypothetical protein